MKTPRRRSLVTSVRVALISGAAAVGWLVVGATGAHAADGLPDLPVPQASVVAEAVSATAEGVFPAGQQVVPSAASPEAAAAAVALEENLPVEPVGELLEQPVDAARSTLEPVTAAVGEAVAVEPASGLLEQPVQTVLRVIEPVTDAVEQTLPVDDLVPVGPVPGAVVDNVLPGGPAAEEILRAGPVTDPVVNAPTVTPATLDASVAPPVAAAPERPAAVVSDPIPGPELTIQAVPSETPDAAAQVEQSVAPRTNPSSSDFLAGLGQSVAAPTSSAAPTLTTSPLPVGTSPGSTSVLASPGATASATGSGGVGTPLRGAGPDSWPEVPADLPYFELFGHLRAGQNDLLSGGVDQPPAPPVFDPGSTPD